MKMKNLQQPDDSKKFNLESTEDARYCYLEKIHVVNFRRHIAIIKQANYRVSCIYESCLIKL